MRKLYGFLKNFLRESTGFSEEISHLRGVALEEGQASNLLMGRILANQVKAHGVYDDIHDAEFKVFSQFGDDGILQYLIYHTRPIPKTFIEFGVEDYTECNTRFLLMNDNWSGLIMDSDKKAMEAIRSQPFYWRFDLKSAGVFITRENINQLLLENGYRGEIGLLSIDVDGNDYWLWEQINSVEPVIVTVEYNSVFGFEHAITIPYDPAFYRTKAHHSNLYQGASLKALCMLAEKKGYALVGCNSSGNNAHFVRKDKLGKIPVFTCAEGYVESRFRESRNEQGKLTYLSGKERLNVIKHMEVFDLEEQRLVRLADLFGL